MHLKTSLTLLLAAMIVSIHVGTATAQDVTATVRTWSGESLQLSQPSLEVFYTIVSKTQESSTPSGGGRVGQVTSMGNLGLGALGTQYQDPSLFTLNRLFGSQAPDTVQGHRQAGDITVYRNGVATQIALDRIASLAFSRQAVKDSSLPPYVAGTHTRSGATVVLTDGARVDADYVNLGAMLLRGTTPGGRVDIPWQDIQTVEFRR